MYSFYFMYTVFSCMYVCTGFEETRKQAPGLLMVEKKKELEYAQPLSLLGHSRCNLTICSKVPCSGFPRLYLELCANELFLPKVAFEAQVITMLSGKETKTVLYVMFLLIKIIKDCLLLCFSSTLKRVRFSFKFPCKWLWWLTLIVNVIGFRIHHRTCPLVFVSEEISRLGYLK